MSEPRKRIRYEEIGYKAITLLIDGSTIVYDATVAGGNSAVGRAVTLSAASTAALAADGEAIVGKLIMVNPDATCTVQVEGFCLLPGGNGAGLTLGLPIVGALNASNAKGYIREVASATAAELAKGRGKIFDAATTTAVVVQL